MSTDDVFPVIAEPTRRRILEALRPGQLAVGDLVEALGVSQPTVSKHLKVLREAGLVSMRADGQRRLYAVLPDPLREAARWLTGFTPATGPGIASNTVSAGTVLSSTVLPGTVLPGTARRQPVPQGSGRQGAAHRIPAHRAAGYPAMDDAGTAAASAAAQDPSEVEAPSGTRPATAAAASSFATPGARAAAPAGPGAALEVPRQAGSVSSAPHPQQIGRSVGRTVEQVTGRAQDLLDRLSKPKFGRRR